MNIEKEKWKMKRTHTMQNTGENMERENSS
jgi:hypothetical protein